MGKIKTLPQHEAQRIAAGEVIERPANVLKELLENAIDAQATQITIYIHDAGKQLIRVVDNGIGMDEQDAQLCFTHHATSKIATIEDLSTINTFGFRGEALSSIASVSKISLITKQKESELATKIELHAGEIIKKETTAHVTGTDLSVSDLFYCIPVRKKFLKKRETEWRHIYTLFKAFCLSYQSIHFKLYSDDNLIHNCPSAPNLMERLAQLEDRTFVRNMIAVESTNQEIAISGALSNHNYFRYDRSHIYFFVNNRWIKNYNIGRALQKGYANVLQQGKYPAAIIFITVNPQEVDINTHPRKEEIKFLHPRRVERALKELTKQALVDNISQQLDQTTTFQKSSLSYISDTQRPSFKAATSIVRPSFDSLPKKNEPYASINTIKTFGKQPIQEIENTTSGTMPVIKTLVETNHPFTVIGQLRKTYIILEQENGLYLIDQHAAHERILYEQFAANIKNAESISLLFPEIISLSEHDMQLIQPYLSLCKKNGIIAEQFSDKQLVIKSAPVHVKHISFSELIEQTIGWIKEYKHLDCEQFEKEIHEKLHAQMACKAAVKASDILSMEKMQQLIKDLYICKNRFSCPHGRPTSWLLDWHEIEKKFKRKL